MAPCHYDRKEKQKAEDSRINKKELRRRFYGDGTLTKDRSVPIYSTCGSCEEGNQAPPSQPGPTVTNFPQVNTEPQFGVLTSNSRTVSFKDLS